MVIYNLDKIDNIETEMLYYPNSGRFVFTHLSLPCTWTLANDILVIFMSKIEISSIIKELTKNQGRKIEEFRVVLCMLLSIS